MKRKPKALEQKWLRAKDIADRYPIGLSTTWDWAKKGKLTPIKVSTRVTVFDSLEVENLFSQNMSSKIDDTKKPKKRKFRRRKRRKRFKSNSQQKSNVGIQQDSKQHTKMIDKFNKRSMQKRYANLPLAKEGILGASRKSIKGRK